VKRLPTLIAGAALGALLAPLAGAEPVTHKTDWMELVKGHRGEEIGAEMREIEEPDDFGTRRVTLAIPKTAIDPPSEMEEVRVVGRRPDKLDLEFPLEFSYEWVDDYENDYYGLVIHLGKDAQIPFRLYMDSSVGFAQ